MQDTRQHILEILKERGEATVDDIVIQLRQRRGEITAVTVRHHLNYLQKEDLITTPQLRHRRTPGRPQHIYTLTEKAEEHFPNNFQRLATGLVEQIQLHLPSDQVNVILEGVAVGMAHEAAIRPDTPMAEKMDLVVSYMNNHGYQAKWEYHDQGFVLLTENCPYHQLSRTTDMLCSLDMRLITALLGVVPRLLSRVSDGDSTCAYLIPTS